MNEHAGDLLSALLDGELPEAHRAEVESHLASCPVCGDERDDVWAARTWLRRLPPVEPSPDALRPAGGWP